MRHQILDAVAESLNVAVVAVVVAAAVFPKTGSFQLVFQHLHSHLPVDPLVLHLHQNLVESTTGFPVHASRVDDVEVGAAFDSTMIVGHLI